MEKTLNFIQKAKKIYGDRFDYSNTIYVNSRTKIEIICKKHGNFLQLPLNHLRQNCPNCNKEERSIATKNSFEDFKKHLSKEHLEKYDYSKTESFGFKDIVTITCPIHGDFKQKIKNHIESKGCYQCGRESHFKTTTKSLKENLKNINLKSNIKILTELDKKVSNKSKIKCECIFHGIFYQTLVLLKRGTFCAKCSKIGYSRTEFLNFCKNKKIKEATFYIIEIFDTNERFLKLGITTKTVQERFRKLNLSGYSYKILHVVKNKPLKIWNLEKELKKLNYENSYKPLRIFPGYTECFKKIDYYDF